MAAYLELLHYAGCEGFVKSHITVSPLTAQTCCLIYNIDITDKNQENHEC